MSQDISEFISNLNGHLGSIKNVTTLSSHRQEDTIALNLLPQLNPDVYLPWTQSAIRPASLMLVLNEICIHQRRKIVECGSGISTLYMSKVLSQTGGELVSIDHDPAWQEVVRSQAESLNISMDPVTFISAPLAPCEHSHLGLDWYDTKVIEESVGDMKIDLLLVDAPIAGHPSIAESRYPALPYFWSHLDEDFAVFLDDCNRNGEQNIAKKWSEDFNLNGQYLPERGNICLFYPKTAKRFNIF